MRRPRLLLNSALKTGDLIELLVSREVFEIFDTASSMLVDLDESRDVLKLSDSELVSLSGHHVLIEGIYKHQPRETVGVNQVVIGPMYSGAITQVNRIAVASREK